MTWRATLLLLAVLAPAVAGASQWEVEATGGLVGTSAFISPAPFLYRGLSFDGPYTTCPLELRDHPRGPEFGCFAALQESAGNIFFRLQGRYGPTWGSRVQMRRLVGGGFGLSAGLLAGLGPRQQRIVTPLPDLLPLDLSAPVLPDDLQAALSDPDFLDYDTTGTGALAYIHASLRYERRLYGSAGGLGAAGLAAFVEGGAGWLPEFPGRADAGLAARAGLHAGLGIRLGRAFASDVTLSLLHVRSLGETPDNLTRPEFRWTGFQLGVVLER